MDQFQGCIQVATGWGVGGGEQWVNNFGTPVRRCQPHPLPPIWCPWSFLPWSPCLRLNGAPSCHVIYLSKYIFFIFVPLFPFSSFSFPAFFSFFAFSSSLVASSNLKEPRPPKGPPKIRPWIFIEINRGSLIFSKIWFAHTCITAHRQTGGRKSYRAFKGDKITKTDVCHFIGLIGKD